jgi:hypothetical protein
MKRSTTRGTTDPLFHTRWVHMFEEDSGAGAIYRPETDDVPLSRRPRERLTLSPDGTARVTAGGPDDRPIDTNAEWKQEGDELVVQTKGERGGAGRVLRVTVAAPTRLLVRKG